MVKAMDLAAFVVKTALEAKQSIVHVHLQKTLYFLQGYFLVTYNRPLFEEPIELWRLGPVVPTVYHHYTIFGAQSIFKVPKYFCHVDGKYQYIDPEPDTLPSMVQRDLRPLIQRLLEIDPFDLVEQSTRQHPIWREHQQDISKGVKVPFSQARIKAYFTKHPEHFPWKRKEMTLNV